jgi:hypothetical protein
MGTVYFYNPGKLDLRALQIMGINAKPNSDNPIGYFGTGFKYAMAVCARIGAKVELFIRTNDGKTNNWIMEINETDFRGKSFDAISLRCDAGPAYGTVIELPFTTELGKNWEPWMVVRELGSNARDEGGDFSVEPTHQFDTTITVTHPDIYDAATKPNFVFLDTDRTEISRAANAVCYKNVGNQYAYYRGIRVGNLPLSSRYTYNFLNGITLTEDRTVRSDYMLNSLVSIVIGKSSNEDYIEYAVTSSSAEGSYFEHNVDMPYYEMPSETFMSVVKRLIEDGAMVTSKARHYYTRYAPKPKRKKLDVTDQQFAKLRRAIEFVTNVGVRCNPDDIIVSDLDAEVYAITDWEDHQIVLNRTLFTKPVSMICTTLLEECLHLYEGKQDDGRDMQNRLLELIYVMYDRD